jgi:hypothetical protein
LARAFLAKLHPGRISGAEIFLVCVLLILGAVASLMIPVGGGFDEETHVLRLWEMSAFHFVPNESLGPEMPFPAIFWELSYRRQVLVRVVPPDFWSRYGGLAIDAHDYIYGEMRTRSVYSPPLLLPQALVMRYLGRRAGMPALTVFYACRFAGLLSYVVLAWLAVRLIPHRKWLLAVLAASPMALFQASTIGADAISNGIGLLFIGGCLAVAARQEIRWVEWGALAFLVFLLFLAKVNLVLLVLLPFFLLRPSRFKMKWGYALLIVTALVFCLVEVGGWNVVAYSRYGAAVEGADPAGQLRYILTHPAAFLQTVLSDLWDHGPRYLREWAGVYGYGYWSVPSVTYVLYALALGLALFVREGEADPGKRTRVSLASVFVGSYLATVASLYISSTLVGSPDIEGVQGRYLIPVMPLLFLALAGLPVARRLRASARWVAVCATGALVCYVAGLILSYHVPCGTTFFQSGLCYQPVYKNWAPNARYSSSVSQEMTLTQEIVPECDGMTELRVWVDASAADREGSTGFTLQEPERALVVLDRSVPNVQMPGGAWFALRFEPDWESTGKLFTLTIRGGESPAGQGIRVAYTLMPEYTVGQLYESGQPVEQDLVFQYGCIAGLRRIWLTGIR